MSSFQSDARLIKSTHLNWIDTLFIAIAAGVLFLITEIYFPGLEERFVIATRTTLAVPLFYLFVFYVKMIRPFMFSNKFINQLLLIPKEIELRQPFTILGLLGLFPQWIGCMIILTSPIHGPWSMEEVSLSKDSVIKKKALAQVKRELLMGDVKALANAKPIDTSSMTAVEINNLSEKAKERKLNREEIEKEEEKQRINLFEKRTLERFPKLKLQIHEEERNDYQEVKEQSYLNIYHFLKIGFIMLIIGGFIDKINNMIQLYKQSKNAR